MTVWGGVEDFQPSVCCLSPSSPVSAPDLSWISDLGPWHCPLTVTPVTHLLTHCVCGLDVSLSFSACVCHCLCARWLSPPSHSHYTTHHHQVAFGNLSQRPSGLWSCLSKGHLPPPHTPLTTTPLCVVRLPPVPLLVGAVVRACELCVCP